MGGTRPQGLGVDNAGGISMGPHWDYFFVPSSEPHRNPTETNKTHIHATLPAPGQHG
jgi:hypothetical protein